MKTNISIVIPCYNEEHRIEITLNKIQQYILKNSIECDYQIVLVDNNSTDNTLNILKSYQKKFENFKIVSATEFKGKGWAVKKGILNADGDIIVFSDADLSTPIEELQKIIFEINNGADIVIGSRQHKDSNIIRHQNFLRESMGKIFNIILRKILYTEFKDTQCGFKGFKKDAGLKLFRLSKVKTFAFDAEILFLANKLNYKIVEIPIKWINSPASKVRIIKDSLKMLFDLIKVRTDYKNGKYNIPITKKQL